MRVLNSRIVLFVALLLTATHTFAAGTLSLATLPFGLKGMVDPNIMFTLDDSGSMQFEYMPESLSNRASYYMFPTNSSVYGTATYSGTTQGFDESSSDNFFMRSSDNNVLYYNPNIEYIPWNTAGGATMDNANPNRALRNPRIPSAGNLDLLERFDVTGTETYQCTKYFLGIPYLSTCTRTVVLFSYSYTTYYNYNGGNRNSLSSYTKVQITQTDYTANTKTFVSPDGTKRRTTREEAQNFANWYQYYRSRVLAARAGIGRAFAQQGSNMRVGFAAINATNQSIDGINSNGSILTGVRPFNGDDRLNFFNRLYDHPIPREGTPLRLASKRVGEYFKRSDSRGPWGDKPGQNVGASNSHLTCRQSYHILMTDGYWSGDEPSVGNSDNTSGDLIKGPNNQSYQYTPQAPYRDNNSNTLADVAMEYWKQDLRPDLENRVPTKQDVDPAFWQHLVTFTVGLGVSGTIPQTTPLNQINWPNPNTDDRKIDDLWHAAVNGRGEFFSAADPETFASSLSNILNRITDRTSSTSSAASNAGTVSEGQSIYQAKFKTGDWSGQLIKFNLQLNSQTRLFNMAQAWDAAEKIPAANNRKIFTTENGIGKDFTAAQLSNTSLATIGGNGTNAVAIGTDVLNYIRGVRTKEERFSNGTFRNRNSLLGDIVNSSPQYVGAPAQRYSDALEAKPYSTFRANNQNRTGVIYVGANDGMLHAFNAETGVELFSYVPRALFSKLRSLTDPKYGHQYFVDATPTIIDAYINNDWRTILVSGLGGGGQGIFALDITNPTSMTADKVLWEFTDENSAELGYTFGEPSIVKLNNGKWAALFTGGYNNNVNNNDNANLTSKTGNPRLYLVDLATGKEITTFAINAVGDTANGFATPVAVDVNGDSMVDYIYVGDLLGNLWKISLEKNKTWGFANTSNGVPQPLFKAGNTQPITTRPIVVRHKQTGYLVLFGTGRLLEAVDDTQDNQSVQSFYGIWDKDNSSNLTRSSLQAQQVQTIMARNGANYRITTQNRVNWAEKKGWYLDLDSKVGERQISNATARNGKIIFTTHIPALDPCNELGAGWLMELEIHNGGRLDFSPFDVNKDNLVNTKDLLSLSGNYDKNGVCIKDCVAPSGTQSTEGNTSKPLIIDLGDNQHEVKILSDSADGSLKQILESAGPSFVGRQSWRLLE